MLKIFLPMLAKQCATKQLCRQQGCCPLLNFEGGGVMKKSRSPDRPRDPKTEVDLQEDRDNSCESVVVLNQYYW